VSTSADTGTRAPGPPKGVIPPSGGGPRSGFLSDVIVELGFAEREAVEQAVRAARSPGHTVARVLIESGAINEEQLAHATAERYGIAYVDLGTFSVDPSAANLIKPSAAKRYQAVPVGFVGGGLLVAMADPADALGVNDIAVMTKMDVKPAVASRPALDALLDRLPLDDLVDADADVPPASAADAGREHAAAPPAPESSAVFWQADAGGVREAPPERAAEAAPEAAPDSGPDAEELARLTGELGDLRARLESTEAELDEARTRAREGKEASAELEEQRELVQEQREQLEEQRSELAGMAARLEQAEAAAEETEALRGQLGAVSAERDDARARIEELEDADRRAEQARQALAELREDSEREREMLAMTERELRASLGEEEKRRQELESRLSEVEGSAFAAERAFEELRSAQGRMRGALRALADPDEDDASGDDDA
jgi:Type II secretion system (T2SS), protein E, N-terminal domain